MTGGNPRRIERSNETTNSGFVDLIEKLKPKVGRLLYIEWHDATALTSFNGWWNKGELDKEDLLIVTSIGIEVDRKDKFISIAQSVDLKNEQYRNLQMIPISCIIKEKVIDEE
ncbi:hypothetical protein M0R19_05325 [Candidatus Pacearchaeota archaeon]|jgi:hypothetical protein|nr:hypothetical protein [Candidatus Pacearchaeota archaeon]